MYEGYEWKMVEDVQYSTWEHLPIQTLTLSAGSRTQSTHTSLPLLLLLLFLLLMSSPLSQATFLHSKPNGGRIHGRRE
jgi:hypothetical protein